MDRDMDQREIDRHRMNAGMIWVGVAVIAAIVVALLLTLLLKRNHRPPHCPNPKTFLESTVPSNCR